MRRATKGDNIESCAVIKKKKRFSSMFMIK